MLKKAFGCIFFLLLAWNVSAQKNYLDKTLSLKAYNQTYEFIFKQISAQTGVVFSYGNFNSQQKTSYSCTKKQLRIVLDELLQQTCSYKIRDKYIILSSVNPNKTSSSKTEKMLLKGRIYDATTQLPLKDVSIFIRVNKHSSLTDSLGQFRLLLPKSGDGFVVSIAKEAYVDTAFWLDFREKADIHIYLQAKQAKVVVSDAKTDTLKLESDSIISPISVSKTNSLKTNLEEFKNLRIWQRLKRKNSNFRNIGDTLFSFVSFSFLPGLSTNRLLSLNTVNKISFNVLGGYSKGVDLLEIGTLMNIDAGNVRYVQIAGVSNIVQGEVEGLQIGGISNINSSSMNGIQIGGVLNRNGAYFSGLQIGGLVNINQDDFYGLQIGGITNLNATYFDGFQLAGISNLNQKGAYGFQLGGISNQVSGNMQGFQLAGIYNHADTMRGVQLSGLVNHATSMRGLQLGFLNFSNENQGLPIGFLSFVRKGYHKIELAYDDIHLKTLAFRTGVERFHNIIFAGGTLWDAQKAITLGYGLGSAFKMSSKWFFNLDMSVQAIHLEQHSWQQSSTLAKVFTGLDYRPLKKINLVAGPTLNIYSYNLQEQVWQAESLLQSFKLYEGLNSNNGLKIWVGAKLALRFL